MGIANFPDVGTANFSDAGIANFPDVGTENFSDVGIAYFPDVGTENFSDEDTAIFPDIILCFYLSTAFFIFYAISFSAVLPI